MFIGAYLLGSLSIFLLLLVYRILFSKAAGQPINDWLIYFSGLSFLMVVLALAGFILLSVWQGVLTFGQTSSYSIPQDYIESGIAGLITLLLGLIGILSPLLASFTATHLTEPKM